MFLLAGIPVISYISKFIFIHNDKTYYQPTEKNIFLVGQKVSYLVLLFNRKRKFTVSFFNINVIYFSEIMSSGKELIIISILSFIFTVQNFTYFQLFDDLLSFIQGFSFHWIFIVQYCEVGDIYVYFKRQKETKTYKAHKMTNKSKIILNCHHNHSNKLFLKKVMIFYEYSNQRFFLNTNAFITCFTYKPIALPLFLHLYLLHMTVLRQSSK